MLVSQLSSLRVRCDQMFDDNTCHVLSQSLFTPLLSQFVSEPVYQNIQNLFFLACLIRTDNLTHMPFLQAVLFGKKVFWMPLCPTF